MTNTQISDVQMTEPLRTYQKRTEKNGKTVFIMN